MKTLKTSILSLIMLVFFSATAMSQNKETIKIKTSAQCDMCKQRIEKELGYVKGVKKANLDLSTKEITVVYNPKKTSPEKIRTAISNIGYDADDIKANNRSYGNLPGCCKKPEQK